MRRPRARSWAALCSEASVALSRSVSRLAAMASRTPSARAGAPEVLRRATIRRASGANAAARARSLRFDTPRNASYPANPTCLAKRVSVAGATPSERADAKQYQCARLGNLLEGSRVGDRKIVLFTVVVEFVQRPAGRRRGPVADRSQIALGQGCHGGRAGAKRAVREIQVVVGVEPDFPERKLERCRAVRIGKIPEVRLAAGIISPGRFIGIELIE